MAQDWLIQLRSTQSAGLPSTPAPDEEIERLRNNAQYLLGTNGDAPPSDPALQQVRDRARYLLQPSMRTTIDIRGRTGNSAQTNEYIPLSPAEDYVPHNGLTDWQNELRSGYYGAKGSLQDAYAAVTGNREVAADASMSSKMSGYYAGQSSAPQEVGQVGSVPEALAWARRVGTSTAINMAPYAATAIASSLAPEIGAPLLIARLGSAGSAFAMGLGDIASAQGDRTEAQTGERTHNTSQALLGAIPYAGADLLMSPLAGKALGLRNLPSGVGATVVKEAIPEVAQEVIVKQFGDKAVDANFDVSGDSAQRDYLNALVGGGVLGGAVGGAAKAGRFVQNKLSSKTPTDLLNPSLPPVTAPTQLAPAGQPTTPTVSEVEPVQQPVQSDYDPFVGPQRPAAKSSIIETPFNTPELVRAQLPSASAQVPQLALPGELPAAPQFVPAEAKQAPQIYTGPQPENTETAAQAVAQLRYDAALQAWKSGTATEQDTNILDLGRPGATAPTAAPSIIMPAEKPQAPILNRYGPAEGPMNQYGQTAAPTFDLTAQTGAPNPKQAELPLETPAPAQQLSGQTKTVKQGELFSPTGKPTAAAYVAPVIASEITPTVDRLAKEIGYKGDRAKIIMASAVAKGIPEETGTINLGRIGEYLAARQYKAAETLIDKFTKESSNAQTAEVATPVETVEAKTEKPATRDTGTAARTTTSAAVDFGPKPLIEEPAGKTLKKVPSPKTVPAMLKHLEFLMDDGQISESDKFLISEYVASHTGEAVQQKLARAEDQILQAKMAKLVTDSAETESRSSGTKRDDTSVSGRGIQSLPHLDDTALMIRAEEAKRALGRGKENLTNPERRALRAHLSSLIERNDTLAVRRLLGAEANKAAFGDILEREGGGTGKVSVEQITNHPALNNFRGKIKVVASPADAPFAVSKTAEAIYRASSGEVWVFANNVPALSDIPKIVTHEMIGHKGVMEYLTPKQISQLMQTVNSLAKVDPKVASTLDEVMKLYASKINRLRAEGMSDLADSVPVVETIARLAEDRKYKSVVNSLVQFLRQVLRRLGFPGDWVNRQNIQDVYKIFRDVDKAITNNEPPIRPDSITGAFEREGALNPKSEQIVQNVGNVITAAKTDSLGWLHRYALNKGKSLQYIVSQYSRHLPSLREVYRLGDKIEAAGHQIRKQYEWVITDLLELKPDSFNTMAELIWEGDRNGWRLDKKYDTKEWSPERVMEYNAARAKFDALVASDPKVADVYRGTMDTPAELRTRASDLLRKMQDEVGAATVTKYQELVAKAEAKLASIDKTSNPEAHAAAMLRLRSAKAQLTRAKNDHLKMTEHLDSLFENKLEGYFPHKRFGDWVVVYKSEDMREAESDLQDAYDALSGAESDADVAAAKKLVEDAEAKVDTLKGQGEHFVVEAFDKQSDADARAKALGGKSFLAEQTYLHSDGVSRKFIQDMSDAATMSFGEGVGTEVARLMNEQYLRSLSNKSIFKSAMSRKMVEGFNQDIPRVLSDEIVKYAGQLPKMEWGGKLRDAVEAVQREGESGVPQNASVVARQVKENYEADQRAPRGQLDGKLAKALHLWYLAMSPAYLTMQLMQTPMISGPMIGAKHGTAATYKKLLDSAKRVMSAMSQQVTDEYNEHGVKGVLHVDFDFDKMDTGNVSKADTKALIEYMRDHNVLSITQDVELTELAKGRGAETRAGTVMKALAMPGHLIEVANRAVTGVAAYELELEKLKADRSLSEDERKEQARAYATDVVAQTHGNYARHNKPYLLKPGMFPMQRTIMLFRSYQHMMGELLVRSFKDAKFMQDPPENLSKVEKDAWFANRAIARRTLYGLIAQHAAAAGTLGIPGISSVLALAGWLGMDDDDEKLETKYRKFLADVTNPAVGEVIAKGLFRAPGIDRLIGDVSSRVGLQDVFNPIRVFDGGAEGRDKVAAFALAAMGPGAGVVANWAEAMKAYDRGQYDKILPNMLPKALADLARAGNHLADDKRSVTDVVNQVIGFRPVSVVREQEVKNAGYDAKNAYATKNAYFANRMAAASSQSERAGVTKEFLDYKRDHPMYKTTLAGIMRSARRKDTSVEKPDAINAEFGDFAND